MTTGEIWVALVLAVDVAFRVIALVIVPRNRRPQTAMAWLLAIFFIPYFGFIAFLAFGSRRLPKKRREKQQAINGLLRARSSLLSPGIVVTPEDIAERPEYPRWLAQTVRMNEKLGAMPMVAGNTLSLLPEYHSSLAAMAAAIRAARTRVHVEFYIMSFDEDTQDFFCRPSGNAATWGGGEGSFRPPCKPPDHRLQRPRGRTEQDQRPVPRHVAPATLARRVSATGFTEPPEASDY